MSSTGKVNAALAAAVIFLLLSSCSAYFAFNRMDASQGWVRHTRDVQNALAQFSMATARAGRLRSEYIDSGDASLLQQQAELVSQIRTAVATIQRLTADNSQQQANSRKLDDLKEQRIDLLGQAIELKKTGNSTAAARRRSAAKAWQQPKARTCFCSACMTPRNNCWRSGRHGPAASLRLQQQS